MNFASGNGYFVTTILLAVLFLRNKTTADRNTDRHKIPAIKMLFSFGCSTYDDGLIQVTAVK
jgi:hypothetical protein